MKKSNNEQLKSFGYIFLGINFLVSLFLVYLDKDGVGLGFLGIVSWCILFSQIRRIKIGEYEIELFTRQETIDSDNRKRLYDSYENVKKFFMLFWEKGCIEKEGYNLISDAYLKGKIFLPNDLLKEIEKYAETAKKSYVLENRVKRQHDEKEIIKLNKKIIEINSIFYNADPASIYRNYLCIK